VAAAGSNSRRNGPPKQHRAIRSTALATVNANVQLIAGRTVNLWLLSRAYASASRRPPGSPETYSDTAISGSQHAAGEANVERTGWKLNQQHWLSVSSQPCMEATRDSLKVCSSACCQHVHDRHQWLLLENWNSESCPCRRISGVRTKSGFRQPNQP